MNRFTEEFKVAPLVGPQSTSGSVMGSYEDISKAIGDLAFIATLQGTSGSPLADGKMFKLEIFEASGSSGSGAAEIAAAESIFTASGSTAAAEILASVPTNLFSQPFVTAKLTTDNSDAVGVQAVLVAKQRYAGQDVNDDADLVTEV